MSKSNSLSECPICLEMRLKGKKHQERHIGDKYECERCGQFIADSVTLADPDINDVRHLVSAWVRRQNKGGRTPAFPDDMQGTPGNWVQNLQHFGFPKTVNEKMDALLNSYADIVKDKFRQPMKPRNIPHLISDIAANDIDEVIGLSELLYERGCIELTADDIVKVGVNGWDRIDEIRKSVGSSNSAFIAMWYDQCTDKYRDATLAAVARCKYEPLILDQHEYNGFVMEQITSLIRQSRFLIADFTCRAEERDSTNKVINGLRGGVYWEAGFAYGMGKTVIHTCEDTDEARCRLHFDVQQYRTIFWKSEELDTNIRDLSGPLPNPNFTERLATNIMAILGEGSYSQAQ